MTQIVDKTGSVDGFFVERARDHGGDLAGKTGLRGPFHGSNRAAATLRLHCTVAKVGRLADADVVQTKRTRHFRSTIDGGQALTLDADTATVSIGGTAGGTTRLTVYPQQGVVVALVSNLTRARLPGPGALDLAFLE